jgi:ParB family chromosome partitioning protein
MVPDGLVWLTERITTHLEGRPPQPHASNTGIPHNPFIPIRRRHTMTANHTSAPTTPTELVHVDPNNLLTDYKVRADTAADRTLVASVREHGVVQPIVAVRLPDGRLRVRMGHRRTLAAIAAGRGSVPVVVSATEDDADTAERIVQQWAENEHRADLTTGDRIGAVAQLTAFGVSAAANARRTKASRAGVDAALTASRSAVAVQVADAHQLTLEEAAVVAEFEDDDSAVAELLRWAGNGQFAHAAQRLRDRRTEDEAQAAGEVAARQSGLRVLTGGAIPEGAKRVAHLLDADGRELDDEAHTSCPGHAVLAVRGWHTYSEPAVDDQDELDEQEDDDDRDEDAEAGAPGTAAGRPEPEPAWTLAAWCVDPASNGHADRWGRASGDSRQQTPTDPDQRTAERCAVITGNKEWKSATTVRRDWLAQFAARKTHPRERPAGSRPPSRLAATRPGARWKAATNSATRSSPGRPHRRGGHLPRGRCSAVPSPTPPRPARRTSRSSYCSQPTRTPCPPTPGDGSTPTPPAT